MRSTLMIYKDSGFWKAYSEASDSRTIETALLTLSQSTCAAIRRRVAENQTTPKSVIAALLTDQSTQVRAAVASRADLPASFFWRLTKDESDAVRLRMLMNPTAPDAVIAYILKHSSQELSETCQ